MKIEMTYEIDDVTNQGRISTMSTLLSTFPFLSEFSRRTHSTIHQHEVLHRSLPKWSQMIVVGDSILPEQAKEIIRRTDSFFTFGGGNDRKYVSKVYNTLSIPEDLCDRLDNWLPKSDFIETSFVHNSWISSCYVYGPHGWCNPNGTIHFIDNIGKWPDIVEVLSDWTILAQEFPFLHLTAILMSGEHGDEGTEPVAGIYVKSATEILIYDPKPHMEEINSFLSDPKNQRDPEKDCSFSFFDHTRERGVPWGWIEDWAKETKNV